MSSDRCIPTIVSNTPHHLLQAGLEGQGEPVSAPGSTTQEVLCAELRTDLEEVEQLIELVELQEEGNNEEVEQSPGPNLPELLTCFETEGELGDRTGIRLRRQLAPRLAAALYTQLSGQLYRSRVTI